MCQSDPETKEFCKKIADKEAARYREELEDYRAKYGVEAAKGKKRKPRKRKSLQLSQSQKKTKQVKEEGKQIEIDTLNIVVPKLRTEEDPEEVFSPSPASDFDDSSHATLPDFVNMMYLRQELQAQLEQSQRWLASLPVTSSFTINTFQGIPKDHMFLGPNPPSDDRYEQGGQILQDGYKSSQMLSAMRQHTSQSFVRRNSAFDSKYDFLNAGDGAIDDDKVEEHLREFERNVFQQMFQSPAYEHLSGFGVGHNLYPQECHMKCIGESRISPSEVSQFDFDNKHIYTREEAVAAPMINKLTSLQTNDWFQFTEHVEIKDA